MVILRRVPTNDRSFNVLIVHRHRIDDGKRSSTLRAKQNKRHAWSWDIVKYCHWLSCTLHHVLSTSTVFHNQGVTKSVIAATPADNDRIRTTGRGASHRADQ